MHKNSCYLMMTIQSNSFLSCFKKVWLKFLRLLPEEITNFSLVYCFSRKLFTLCGRCTHFRGDAEVPFPLAGTQHLCLPSLGKAPFPAPDQLTRPFSSVCAWTQSFEQWLPLRRCGHTLYFSLASSFPTAIKETLGFQECQ